MTVTNRGLTEAEAQRFYDRHGRQLEFSDRFEERAKAIALRLADLQPGERILELGTGTGKFQAAARVWAEGAALVVGMDLSPTMLAIAHERAPHSHYVRASAAQLPFAPGSFDVAFSTYVLDLLPEEVITAALAGLHDVLRPGGRLVLCSLTEGVTPLERSFMALWKRIHRLAPEKLGGCRPIVLEPRVRAAGFEIVAREHVGQLGMPSEVVLATR